MIQPLKKIEKFLLLIILILVLLLLVSFISIHDGSQNTNNRAISFTSTPLRKLPATWTPKPTQTRPSPTRSPSPSETSMPTIKPTNTPQGIPTQPSDFDPNDYEKVYNPVNLITNPDDYFYERIQVEMYIIQITPLEDGTHLLLLGTSRSGSNYKPIAVLGFSGENLKSGYMITVYGIGMENKKYLNDLNQSINTPTIWGEYLFINCASQFGCN